MTGNNIKAILFDFVGVLLFQRNDYTPNPLVDKIDNLIGSVTNDVLFERETRDKFALSKVKFNNILEEIVNKYEPYQPLWNLLPKLKRHYRLAILNNGTGLTLPMFKAKFDIDNKFDAFISSALEGMKKPESEIYLFAAKKLNVAPTACLFMDDSYKNIQGAQQVGMKTLWWNAENNREKVFEEFINMIDLT